MDAPMLASDYAPVLYPLLMNGNIAPAKSDQQVTYDWYNILTFYC